jgi:hypothetical protein
MLLQSGKKIAEIYSPKYRFGGEVQPSRNGQRFAFVRSQTKDGTWRATKVELCVYDLKARTEVSVANVVPLPQLKLAFALSPDGSLLAMQTDRLLRICDWRHRSDTLPRARLGICVPFGLCWIIGVRS